jgi:mono/diheme cytochrome c family protein
MHAQRCTIIGVALLAACASAGLSAARDPLGAYLGPGAKTGPQTALRVDPNAKVIVSNASALPPAAFLPSQAARGEQVYAQTCGNCHEPGQLIGQGFVESWNNRRVYDLYALVRGTMPLDNPGGLTDGQYLDVVAYLLQANHHAADAVDSLRADTLRLRNTKIDVGPHTGAP